MCKKNPLLFVFLASLCAVTLALMSLLTAEDKAFAQSNANHVLRVECEDGEGVGYTWTTSPNDPNYPVLSITTSKPVVVSNAEAGEANVSILINKPADQQVPQLVLAGVSIKATNGPVQGMDATLPIYSETSYSLKVRENTENTLASLVYAYYIDQDGDYAIENETTTDHPGMLRLEAPGGIEVDDGSSSLTIDGPHVVVNQKGQDLQGFIMYPIEVGEYVGSFDFNVKSGNVELYAGTVIVDTVEYALPAFCSLNSDTSTTFNQSGGTVSIYVEGPGNLGPDHISTYGKGIFILGGAVKLSGGVLAISCEVPDVSELKNPEDVYAKCPSGIL